MVRQVAHLDYPGGAYVRQNYTSRGQLAATGWDDDDSNWWMKLAAYAYQADGKVGEIDSASAFADPVRLDHANNSYVTVEGTFAGHPGGSFGAWPAEIERITLNHATLIIGASPPAISIAVVF